MTLSVVGFDVRFLTSLVSTYSASDSITEEEFICLSYITRAVLSQAGPRDAAVNFDKKIGKNPESSRHPRLPGK